MNTNAEKWVEALESGDFRQGTGRLRCGGDHYCCLGVACEIYRRETGKGEWHALPGEAPVFRVEGLVSDCTLLQPVRDWLGVRTPTGAYLEVEATDAPSARWGSHNHSLTGRNDKGYTFAEIAEIIRSEPRGLFS